MSLKHLVLCVCAVMVTKAYSDHHETTENMDAKKQEMMKKWQEAATPGTAHKVLEPMVGDWTYTSKMWEAPKAKAEESTGTATMKWALGGRFIEQEFKGQAMGQPFEGRGFIGYNNVDKTYETTWFDNMMTSTMFSRNATFETRSKTLKDSGLMTCPMSENHKREYRAEWKLEKNSLRYTMWTKDDGGKEFKQMEINLKRSKEPRVAHQ